MKINRQDTNGVKPLLAVGELGYDNYPSGGDIGRVYVGTGSSNIAQAKKSEVVTVDGKVDTHVGRADNPHTVTKAQVGLGNVDNTSDVNKPISTSTQNVLDQKQNVLVSGTNIKTIEGQSIVGPGNIDLTKTDVGLNNVDNTADSTKVVASAGKWTTSRLINGTAVDGTINITTSQWGTSRNITIGSTTKSVNGSADTSWSLAEIGAIGTASPAFTGVPTAPTAPVNDNSNQIATTAYVASQVANTAVNLTGDQTVDGIKTFTLSPIVPTPTTNTQAANKGYVDTKQANLGFTPVQQGTGIGQTGSVVKIGWSGTRTKITINETDMGNIVMDEHIGIANSPLVKTALNASGSAPIYACRAWVNFNGTGTVAIRASGNVSSITDNGVGNYTVNFTTAMPDVNYSVDATTAPVGLTASDALLCTLFANTGYNTSNFRINTHSYNGGFFDAFALNIAVFR